MASLGGGPQRVSGAGIVQASDHLCAPGYAGLGYQHAKIPTQTTTWLACKVYLDLGFVPIPQNAVNSREGWRIIKALTDHEVLQLVEPASADEIEIADANQVSSQFKEAEDDDGSLCIKRKYLLQS